MDLLRTTVNISWRKILSIDLKDGIYFLNLHSQIINWNRSTQSCKNKADKDFQKAENFYLDRYAYNAYDNWK